MSQQILIVGIGNMGTAMVKGLHRSDMSASLKISVDDVSTERLDKITTDFPVKVATFMDSKAKTKGGKVSPKNSPDVIVLCVKPQDLPQVALKFSSKIKSDTLVISIIAGMPIAAISQALKFTGPIIRAMPNIGANVGLAATALCGNERCLEKHQDLGLQIFNAIGEAHWTKESLMDAVTGLSGSGPAYIYMVIEALTDGGVKMGIPRRLSEALAVQTVLGSAMLVKSTGLHPAILRDQVTTPGGTTIAAIHELEAHGLRAMLISAVATATEKSALLRNSAALNEPSSGKKRSGKK